MKNMENSAEMDIFAGNGRVNGFLVCHRCGNIDRFLDAEDDVKTCSRCRNEARDVKVSYKMMPKTSVFDKSCYGYIAESADASSVIVPKMRCIEWSEYLADRIKRDQRELWDFFYKMASYRGYPYNKLKYGNMANWAAGAPESLIRLYETVRDKSSTLGGNLRGTVLHAGKILPREEYYALRMKEYKNSWASSSLNPEFKYPKIERNTIIEKRRSLGEYYAKLFFGEVDVLPGEITVNVSFGRAYSKTDGTSIHQWKQTGGNICEKKFSKMYTDILEVAKSQEEIDSATTSIEFSFNDTRDELEEADLEGSYSLLDRLWKKGKVDAQMAKNILNILAKSGDDFAGVSTPVEINQVSDPDIWRTQFIIDVAGDGDGDEPEYLVEAFTDDEIDDAPSKCVDLANLGDYLSSVNFFSEKEEEEEKGFIDEEENDDDEDEKVPSIVIIRKKNDSTKPPTKKWAGKVVIKRFASKITPEKQWTGKTIINN